MPILGAHMSIAGGVEQAVVRAAEAGCDCVQIFTKNNNQWRAKPLPADAADRFQAELRRTGVSHPLSHASYLINLAAADDALWERSVEGLVVELQRAAALGIPYVVVHPGAHTVLSEEQGLERICRAIDQIHRQTEGLGCELLLENTAGQGTCLGWRLEQLAAILEAAEQSERLGVCIDTCHLHAAGYDITERRRYRAFFERLDGLIGLDRVRAFHLNDSRRELGSRVDRHEHIGDGELGLKPFGWLVNDPRFQATPMYLETAKGEDDQGRDWDVVNLERLRRLVRG